MIRPTKELEITKENIGKSILLDDWIVQSIIEDIHGEPMSFKYTISVCEFFGDKLYCDLPIPKFYDVDPHEYEPLQSHRLVFLDFNENNYDNKKN